MKLALFFYCNWLKGRSDSMEALAEDHINDVASNLGAVLAAVVTKWWPSGWWVDAVAAIVIALVILGRWTAITYSQVRWCNAEGRGRERVTVGEGVGVKQGGA